MSTARWPMTSPGTAAPPHPRLGERREAGTRLWGSTHRLVLPWYLYPHPEQQHGGASSNASRAPLVQTLSQVLADLEQQLPPLPPTRTEPEVPWAEDARKGSAI
ncbi:hypothetical protein CB1_000813003 [Camelus ferus]|nr:hypothetical protein CB1_000813003 [Camelus ferus]